MNGVGNLAEQVHTCIVCTQEKVEGLFLWHHFICRQCEAEMVKTDVEDQRYPFFIKQMRKIWLKENA